MSHSWLGGGGGGHQRRAFSVILVKKMQLTLRKLMMVFMVRGKRARETSDNKKIIHSVVNKPSCKNEDNKKVTICELPLGSERHREQQMP